jgi:hypothetical protein
MAALSQTAANVLKTAGTSQSVGVSGGTITAGMPIYIDAADSNAIKACRANAAGTANCDGIALTGSSAGQPLVYCTIGNINLGATLAVGQTYCVSDAVAGEIVPHGDLASADYVTILGVASTTSNLILDILNSATAKA